MIKQNLRKKSLVALVTCVATICLLFMGMRTPDLSRPSRPKPKPRAYIEEQFKKIQQAQAKKSLHVEPVAELPHATEVAARVCYGTVYFSTFHGAASRPLFSNSSRAPPAFLS